jgi:hypothetical protein
MARGVGGHSPANVQKYLKGQEYPARKDDLLKTARANRATEEIIETIERLPDEEFGGPQDVMKAYGEEERGNRAAEQPRSHTSVSGNAHERGRAADRQHEDDETGRDGERHARQRDDEAGEDERQHGRQRHETGRDSESGKEEHPKHGAQHRRD